MVIDRALVVTLLMPLLLCCHSRPTGTKEAREKENILLIVADDMGTQLGTYGDPLARTPHLDRLALRGTVVERAYCQYPLCNPSRTSLLAGRRPETIHVYDNSTPPERSAVPFVYLPDHLRQHGYFLFRAGKVLHATFESAIRWDEVADLSPLLGKTPSPPAPRKGNKRGQPSPGQDAPLRGGVLAADNADSLTWWLADDEQARRLSDTRVADRTIEWLARAPRDRPFFAAIGLSATHKPYIAPRRSWDALAGEDLRPPAAPADDLADVPEKALRQAVSHGELSLEAQTDLRRAYYAAASYLDEQVGRILAALDAAGLADRTLVVFTSDHGTHLGEHGGLWEKTTLFEESLRVPLLLAGPGVASGRFACSTELLDLYPTLLGLAGVKLPAGLEGKDLRSWLAEPARCAERTALSMMRLGLNDSQLAFSLRGPRYRYTEWVNRYEDELYDHEVDPAEHHNLAGDAAAAKARAKQRRLLRKRLDPVAAPAGEPAAAGAGAAAPPMR